MPKLPASVQKAAQKPRAPKAAKKPRTKTVADVPKSKRDPKSLAERMGKAFALTDCKRVVALAEKWSEDRQAKAAGQERRKTLLDKYHKAENVRERQSVADQLQQTRDRVDASTQSIRACVTDLMQLILEDLADGATVFAAAMKEGAQENGELVEDPHQSRLGEVKGEPEVDGGVGSIP